MHPISSPLVSALAAFLFTVAWTPAKASDSPPDPVSHDAPYYPDAAYRNNVQGRVLVRVLVGPNLGVEDAVMEKGDSVFAKSAIKSARSYRFNARFDDEGRPVRVWVRIPMDYKLADAETDPRILSDSLWRDRRLSTPAVMRQQRESFLRMMRKPDEVWLFRIDPNSEGDALPANARSRFARCAVLEAANIEDPATRAKIRTLLSDVRTHARPPRLKGEFSPRLGVRFVTAGEVVDVVISFADAALFLKDGRHLWAGSAMPHWRAWGQVAHAAFPEDPNFARYANSNPMSP